MPSSEDSINSIEILRASFTDEEYLLSSAQLESLKKVLKLLNEGPESLSRLSSSTQRRRKIARNLFMDVIALGYEPFILCSLALSITQLAELQQDFVRSLSAWWKTATTPKGLQILTRKLCREHSLENLLGPRQPMELTNMSTLEVEPSARRTAVLSRKRQLAEVDGTEDERTIRHIHNPVITEAGIALAADTGEDGAEDAAKDAVEDAAGVADGVADGVTDGALPDGRLTGNVYKLTALDAVRVIVIDSAAPDNVLLTIPVYPETQPFITIPCPKKLAMQFLTKRPRIM